MTIELAFLTFEHILMWKRLNTRFALGRWSAIGVQKYAIQCNFCFKWRVIPTREEYEAIGEHILENPFVCAHTREWQENAKCDDPTDLDYNEPTLLWAIDEHNIPRPPKGWNRKVVLRAENSKKFADM